MAVPTRKVIDEYFNSLNKSEKYIKKIRSQIDRQELYDYENKIGKRIFEMNEEEILDMINTFGSRRGTNCHLSYNSYGIVIGRLRDIFNYYIDNYEVIRNPLNNRKLKGMKVIAKVSESREIFTKEMMDELISNIRRDFSGTGRANYYECIIRLFHDGFASTMEIAAMDETMIDFKNKTVMVPGRTIQLSDRTFQLLTWVHNAEPIDTNRGQYVFVPWQDKYFTYITRPSQAANINNKTLDEVSNIINVSFSQNVRYKYGITYNLRTFYLFGFYEYLIKTFGKEEADNMLTSVRDSDASKELMKSAAIYGINFYDNVTLLKMKMSTFVDMSDIKVD